MRTKGNFYNYINNTACPLCTFLSLLCVRYTFRIIIINIARPQKHRAAKYFHLSERVVCGCVCGRCIFEVSFSSHKHKKKHTLFMCSIYEYFIIIIINALLLCALFLPAVIAQHHRSGAHHRTQF